VQGNLDPLRLLAPLDALRQQVGRILASTEQRPGHIFNLGHGVFPSVDPDTLTRLAALVRERSAAPVAA
jgi:uroporphyrinogen decarboxylase